MDLTAQPITPGQQQFSRCPRCGQQAYVREDNTLGRHWDSQGKLRNRCPQGERAVPPAQPRRRVQVTIDVLIPAGQPLTAYRVEAARVLREHALSLDVHVLHVTTEENP